MLMVENRKDFGMKSKRKKKSCPQHRFLAGNAANDEKNRYYTESINLLQLLIFEGEKKINEIGRLPNTLVSNNDSLND